MGKIQRGVCKVSELEIISLLQCIDIDTYSVNIDRHSKLADPILDAQLMTL